MARTLNYPPMINATKDAERIKQSIKFLGADEKFINQLIGHRSLAQRLEIADAYESLYQKNLVDTLHRMLVGDHSSLVRALFYAPFELLATELCDALSQVPINYRVMTDIICLCTKPEIYLLDKAYLKKIKETDPENHHRRSLVHDISRANNSPFGLLLVELLHAERCQDQPNETIYQIDQSLVDQDVKDLFAAGTGHPTKGDPTKFIMILTKRSKNHIKVIWDTYLERFKRTLVEAISEKFSDPFRYALNTMIMALLNMRLLIICQMYHSLDATNLHMEALIRIVCLRCEIDLKELKELYNKIFGKSILQSFQHNVNGPFRDLLLILIDDAHEASH